MKGNPDPREADNADTMMTLGRVLYYELRKTSLMPDLRASKSLLSDDPEYYEARIVIEGGSSRQWLNPDAMRVLADHDIAVEPIKREHWQNALYSEFRVDIPDEVLEAYERAAEELGVPPAPKDWGTDEKGWYTHENIMSSYRAEQDE